MGAQVYGDLEAAMVMARRLEVCRNGGDGAKASGDKKGFGKSRKQNKKETVVTMQGNEMEETVRVIQT